MHIFGVSVEDWVAILTILSFLLGFFGWGFKKLVMDNFQKSIDNLNESIDGLHKSIETMNKKHEKEIKEITDDLTEHNLMIQGLDKDMERIFEESDKNRHSVIK